jgi:hypothetical protein
MKRYAMMLVAMLAMACGGGGSDVSTSRNSALSSSGIVSVLYTPTIADGDAPGGAAMVFADATAALTDGNPSTLVTLGSAQRETGLLCILTTSVPKTLTLDLSSSTPDYRGQPIVSFLTDYDGSLMWWLYGHTSDSTNGLEQGGTIVFTPQPEHPAEKGFFDPSLLPEDIRAHHADYYWTVLWVERELPTYQGGVMVAADRAPPTLTIRDVSATF